MSANRVPHKRLHHQLADWWIRFLSTIASLIFGAVVLIAFGLSSLPTSIPVIQFVRLNPVLAVISSLTLVGITILAWLIIRTANQENDNTNANRTSNPQDKRVIVAFGIATISFALFVSLLGTILLEPGWCLSIGLCPSTPSVVATNPQGVHDTNLEVYPIAVQSDTYVLLNAPASYTAQTVPSTIAAQRIDGQGASPYRVAIGVHNLHSAKDTLLIKRVSLRIITLVETPHPLNTWFKGNTLNYTTGLYDVSYGGESPPALLPAHYEASSFAHQQLAPGESDTITVQMVSHSLANIQFQIEVTYAVSTAAGENTLLLPQIYSVVFSDKQNWHEYVLQGDQLTPVPTST
jgi:hypothetical protein